MKWLMMKKIIIYIISIFWGVSSAFAADNNDALWENANDAYVNGNYGEAIVLYDSIVQSGYVSGKLYYNLGNAHFKVGHLGKSILNYKRALRFKPYDADFRYNLSIAESRTKDKIESLPGFAFGRWVDGWRSYLTSNDWGIVSLVMLALALGGVLVYLLLRNKRRRKIGFAAMVTFGALALLTLWFAIAEKRDMSSRQGVVMATAASVNSSPEGNGRELFVLHEGTVVDITGDYATWVEVALPDGNKGWMQAISLEMI